jgi:hypothetical protein
MKYNGWGSHWLSINPLSCSNQQGLTMYHESVVGVDLSIRSHVRQKKDKLITNTLW